MIHMTSWQTAGMGKVGLVVCLFLFASACGGTSEIVEVTTTTVPTTTTTVPSASTTTISAMLGDSLPSVQALADGKQIFASFEGNGSSVLNSLDSKGQFSLIIASDSGPLKVFLENEKKVQAARQVV